MGMHHRREDQTVTVVAAPAGRHAAPVMAAPFHPVPHDAPPAGLGYPAPTAYRPHPVTGVPMPPHATAPARPRRRATRGPLAVAVAGAAVGLIGTGAQLPGLVDAVTATTASTAPAPANAAGSTPAPAVAGQCATVVADAIDDTVTALGGTPSGQWAQIADAREQSLAATYGDTSREQRAYAEGVDDILGWLRDGTEDYGAVTARVAQTVATTCAS
jgi:hypothetical protein